ncbi:MAG TPA: ribonuclease P protein component 1 [Candidatus Deferrimicrobium sp.]|nr:ribonuclease P protein component 1 [Candidatus Deferrimicrobium sp.]
MTVTPKTLIYHCLIGLEVKIVQSSNQNYHNLNGKVVDETKNTLIIEIGDKEKRIPKKNSTFQFRLQNKKAVEVNGKLLLGRPEERIKKKISYKWII